MCAEFYFHAQAEIGSCVSEVNNTGNNMDSSSTRPGPKFPRSLPLLRNQRALLAPQDNFPSGSVATYGPAMYRKDRASGWKGPLGLTSKSMDKQ